MFIVIASNYDYPAEFDLLNEAIDFVNEYCIDGAVFVQMSDSSTDITQVWPES